MSENNSLSDEIQDILDLVLRIVDVQAIGMENEHNIGGQEVGSPQHESLEISLEESYPIKKDPELIDEEKSEENKTVEGNGEEFPQN